MVEEGDGVCSAMMLINCFVYRHSMLQCVFPLPGSYFLDLVFLMMSLSNSWAVIGQ